MKDAKGHGSDARGGSAAHQTGVSQVGHTPLPPTPPGGHEGNDFHRRIADMEKQQEIIRGRKQMEANAAEWDRRGQFAQAAAIRQRLRMMP